MSASYEAGKAPSVAPWTWNKLAFHFIEIRGSGVVGDFHVENDDEANAICRAAHEAQAMRAALAEWVAADQELSKAVDSSVDSHYESPDLQSAMECDMKAADKRLDDAESSIRAALSEFPK